MTVVEEATSDSITFLVVSFFFISFFEMCPTVRTYEVCQNMTRPSRAPTTAKIVWPSKEKMKQASREINTFKVRNTCHTFVCLFWNCFFLLAS